MVVVLSNIIKIVVLTTSTNALLAVYGSLPFGHLTERRGGGERRREGEKERRREGEKERRMEVSGVVEWWFVCWLMMIKLI